MTRFVGTPLRGTEFANAGDEAVSARVSGDTQPRVRIDAGGRITWSDGTSSGDTALFRAAANSLLTYDLFTASAGLVTLTTNGAPTESLPDGAIAVDTDNDAFYFRSGGSWTQVQAGVGAIYLDDLLDVTASTAVAGDFLKFDGANWVPDSIPAINYLDDIGDVTISAPVMDQVLTYNGSTWVNQNPSIGSGNLDGGNAVSNYGAITALDGGTA